MTSVHGIGWLDLLHAHMNAYTIVIVNILHSHWLWRPTLVKNVFITIIPHYFQVLAHMHHCWTTTLITSCTSKLMGYIRVYGCVQAHITYMWFWIYSKSTFCHCIVFQIWVTHGGNSGRQSMPIIKDIDCACSRIVYTCNVGDFPHRNQLGIQNAAHQHGT